MQSFAYISVTLWILAGNRKARTVEQNGEMVRYRNRESTDIFFVLFCRKICVYQKKVVILHTFSGLGSNKVALGSV